jgi:hypothetical protein
MIFSGCSSRFRPSRRYIDGGELGEDLPLDGDVIETDYSTCLPNLHAPFEHPMDQTNRNHI